MCLGFISHDQLTYSDLSNGYRPVEHQPELLCVPDGNDVRPVKRIVQYVDDPDSLAIVLVSVLRDFVDSQSANMLMSSRLSPPVALALCGQSLELRIASCGTYSMMPSIVSFLPMFRLMFSGLRDHLQGL